MFISEELLKLAHEYMATKETRKYYTVNVYNEELDQIDNYWANVSAEEIEGFFSLREKYGQKEWLKHLKEVIPDDDDRQDALCASDDLIFDIELDSPQNMYAFRIHELTPTGLSAYCKLIDISDDKYAKLLALCLGDNTMNFNKLEYADKDLYSYLHRCIDRYYGFNDYDNLATSPYLVTMDEAMDDIEKILKAHPEYRQDSHTTTGYPYD